MKRLFWMTALLLAIPVLARADCADSLWVCKLKQYEPNPSIRNIDNTSPECEGPAARRDVKKIKDAYDTLPDTLSRFKSVS